MFFSLVLAERGISACAAAIVVGWREEGQDHCNSFTETRISNVVRTLRRADITGAQGRFAGQPALSRQ
jgi:hypothetical protein